MSIVINVRTLARIKLKAIISIFAFIAGFQTLAQNDFSAINRDSVRTLVMDLGKETYYPKLLGRFNRFDTSLTLNDYRLLYYGYVFQKEYFGYADQKQKEISNLIADKKFNEAFKLCDSILAKIPISLTANYLKGLAIYLNNKEDTAYVQFKNRYRGLRDAILSTGNGLKCESAFKTIFISDEYDIMYKYFEIDGYKTQSLVYPCDKFEIKPSKYFKANLIYFETSEPLLSMEEKMKKN